jgi:hypothetical protein
MSDNNLIKLIYTKCEDDMRSFDGLYHYMNAVSKVFTPDITMIEMTFCFTRIASTYISLLAEIGDDKYKKDNNDYIFEIKSLEAQYTFWLYEMRKLEDSIRNEASNNLEIREKGNGRAEVVKKDTSKPSLKDYALQSRKDYRCFLSDLKKDEQEVI